jgi:hypothetical protein
MAARLVEASTWVFFDVLAPGAAAGAHVAMSLRSLLPGATIRSEPDRSPSGDELRPHLLHCRAAFAGASVAQAREAVAAALPGIDVLTGEGAQARALVIFREDGSDRAARAA